MSARSVTLWYGVCDRCGAEDGDDSRPTEAEARARMWVGGDGTELCWDCCEAEDDKTEARP